ncbi:MAG: hypothetical protein AAGJ97_16055, partial [Planctomycetota bacterium]
MHQINRSCTLCRAAMMIGLIVPCSAVSASAALAAGDRRPGVDFRLPEDVFRHLSSDGRVIDVTAPPYGAVGEVAVYQAVATDAGQVKGQVQERATAAKIRPGKSLAQERVSAVHDWRGKRHAPMQ